VWAKTLKEVVGMWQPKCHQASRVKKNKLFVERQARMEGGSKREARDINCMRRNRTGKKRDKRWHKKN
jgi:hypothetical protein